MTRLITGPVAPPAGGCRHFVLRAQLAPQRNPLRRDQRQRCQRRGQHSVSTSVTAKAGGAGQMLVNPAVLSPPPPRSIHGSHTRHIPLKRPQSRGVDHQQTYNLFDLTPASCRLTTASDPVGAGTFNLCNTSPTCIRPCLKGKSPSALYFCPSSPLQPAA